VTQRDRIVLIVLGVVALLGGYYMAVLKPQRAELARLSEEVTRQEDRRDAAQQKVSQGEAARARYAEDYETIVRIGRAVPLDDQVPSLVFGVEATARRHKVDLRKLKLRASGDVAAAPVAPPAAATDTTTSKPAAPGGVAATPAAAATAPPGSAVGSAGFPTLPFDFEFDSDFFKFERFLAAVERYSSTSGEGDEVKVRGRLITIDGFGLKASKKTGFPRVSATISATTYVDSEGARALADASPAGPTAAATGTSAAATPAAEPAPSPTTTANVRGVTP
jgi:hypothetical protein